MTNLRLVLLATTALTAMQFAASSSRAQTAPLVMAQAAPEPGKEGTPPPKGAPARPAPPAAAPPPRPPRPAPPPPPPPPRRPPPRRLPRPLRPPGLRRRLLRPQHRRPDPHLRR